jgi:hypothetical protein
MRTSVLVTLVLLVFAAFAGVGGAIWIVTRAMDAAPPTRDPAMAHLTMVIAVYAEAMPLLIGVLALVGVGVISAVNQSREEQVMWLAHLGRAAGGLR